MELSPEPPEDGLTDREAGPWVKDKLLILANYFPAFGQACSAKARRWSYADAFAGSGVNRIEGTDMRLAGSALLALSTKPEFDRCLLMEKGRFNFEALEQRASPYADRAVVRRGDCNLDLLPAMHDNIDRRAPLLCLLDPEGLELHWATIQELSAFRVGRFKTELLILFDADGLSRVFPRYGIDAWAQERLLRFWGEQSWQPIWDRRRRDEMSPLQTWEAYLALYEKGLRGLGYRYVFHRAIVNAG